MAAIVDALKNLHVENGKHKANDNRRVSKKRELILSLEEAVSSASTNNYILAVCGTQSDPDFRIAIGLSNHKCIVYSIGETISKTISLEHNQATIVGIKFSPTSRNILYTATSDGQITACDLRAKGKVVAKFKDSTEDGKLKPLDSFDISCDERLLAGGTEHTGGDAFILFWDIRNNNPKNNNKSSLLGGYWESHVEDVTCLAFHSNKRDVLASGSTDGLINVFDLTQSTEDSALTYSLNTESSVDRLGWLNNDNLWCTTHTHSLQLWNCEDASPYAKFERSHLVLPQDDDPDNNYVVRFHASNALQQPFLLAGSHSAKGENLRCMSVVQDRIETIFEIVGNKQLVRDSWVHEKSGSLVTVGEGGLVNVWRQIDPTSVEENSGHKLMEKIGQGKIRDRQHRLTTNRVTPY